MKIYSFTLFSGLFGFYAAMALFAGTVSAPTAESRQAGPEFAQLVQVEVGDREFAPGDSITIQEVRGTIGEIKVGETYCVSGRYTLSSQDEAELSLFVTTTEKTPSAIEPEQTVRVKKGQGPFRLIKRMTAEGYLHLTFYSKQNGQGFGGMYFGQGPWVLREKKWSYLHPAGGAEEPVVLTGANKILFNYLGNPVEPPANLAPAYTKEGLTKAMQTAGQKAGVKLVRLEIDDSEFPFLVGVVFANKDDKEKFIAEVKKLPDYEFSGGVSSDTTFAMNLVPSGAFPGESAERIYHRGTLRMSVLNEKITLGK